MTRWVDAHCHVDLFPRPERLLAETERLGITTIAVTNLPSHFHLGYPHFRRYRRARPAVGLHPLLVTSHTAAERADFLRALPMTSYVGEVGLDGSTHGRAFLDEQRVSFEFVLEALARSPHLVTVHSRGAEAEVLDRAVQHGVRSMIFHWYSGPVGLIDSIVAAGHAFSVNASMLRSASGRRILDKIPPDRLLTESDGPHIKANGAVQDPATIPHLVTQLGEVTGLSPEELAQQIFNNLKTLVPR